VSVRTGAQFKLLDASNSFAIKINGLHIARDASDGGNIMWEDKVIRCQRYGQAIFLPPSHAGPLDVRVTGFPSPFVYTMEGQKINGLEGKLNLDSSFHVFVPPLEHLNDQHPIVEPGYFDDAFESLLSRLVLDNWTIIRFQYASIAT